MNRNIKSNALPIVITISAIILLLITGLFCLLNGKNLIIQQINNQRSQLNNIESAFLLYSYDSTFVSKLQEDRSLILYNDIPHSKVIFNIEQWGLYEKVTLKGVNGYPQSCRLIGNKYPFKENGTLYYACKEKGLSITGASVLEGKLFVPLQGVTSKQIKWEFFSGKEPDKENIYPVAGNCIPLPLAYMVTYTDSLFANLSICNTLEKYETSSIIYANKIIIDNSTSIKDNSLIVARTIVVTDSTVLKAQLFARDSIIIGDNVTLKYPSGLFVNRKNSNRYIEIGGGSVVNGYTIVDGEESTGIGNANYNLKQGAIIRGLVYVNGASMMHGMVNGAAVLNNNLLFVGNEYYNHTFYDFILLENSNIAYPIWLTSNYGKKEVSWIN